MMGNGSFRSPSSIFLLLSVTGKERPNLGVLSPLQWKGLAWIQGVGLRQDGRSVANQMVGYTTDTATRTWGARTFSFLTLTFNTCGLSLGKGPRVNRLCKASFPVGIPSLEKATFLPFDLYQNFYCLRAPHITVMGF